MNRVKFKDMLSSILIDAFEGDEHFPEDQFPEGMDYDVRDVREIGYLADYFGLQVRVNDQTYIINIIEVD